MEPLDMLGVMGTPLPAFPILITCKGKFRACGIIPDGYCCCFGLNVGHQRCYLGVC